VQTFPYSIYVDKRPLKIAFLVDPMGDSDLIDHIIAYNHSKWGGRYNPIIPCDGTSMSERWWEFLLAYDPDVIKSFVPLSDEVVKRIEHFLSPYLVEVPRGEQDTVTPIRLNDEGLSILPTPENTAQVCHSFFDQASLVLFEIGESADPLLRRFIRNNFGVYEPMLHIDQALSRNVVRSLKVDDRESLSLALQQLTLERVVYPAQICSIPNNLPEADWDSSLGGAFAVVVGDSLEDMIHAWNRALLLSNYERSALSHVWVPTELARDNGIEAGLREWILKGADPGGTTTQRVDFVSFSLKHEELEDIANRLTNGWWLHKNLQVLTEPPVPVYRSFPFFRIKEGMDLYRAVADQEVIVLKEPEVVQGVRGGECWVADVYIELKSKLFENIIGPDYWYRLPRRNMLAHQMFGSKPSRIEGNGLPSVIMTRPSMITNTRENELRIKLPGDDAILRSLALAPNTPYHDTGDPREKFTSRPFSRATRSDKGRYLTGFLDLFSGLHAAYDVLRSRYWRRMFDALSAQDATKDAKKRQEVINRLGKIPSEHSGKPKGEERLAEYVLQLAKTVSISSKELPFERFAKEAQREWDEYNSQHEGDIAFEQDDVRDGVTDLMERGILMAGIRSHCPSCGIANWYKVDDVCQVLECTGCNSEYYLRAEEKWYYKLNHLLLSGYAYHGLAPVVLVLGEMLLQSRTSFMMSPSLCLYDKPDGAPVCELDIICVQDGKFIIGEVKNGVRLFDHSDFEKTKEVAKRLRPDKVIFSSLDTKPNRFVTQEIEKLKKELASMAIEVEWYQLAHYIFEPRPVT